MVIGKTAMVPAIAIPGIALHGADRKGEDMDTYTKAVLSVIAIALIAIVLQNSGVLPAHAAVVSPLPGMGICSQARPGAFWDCAQVVNGALVVRAQ